MSAPKFTTLGCRLNAYETEAMKELSQQAGLTDAVVVNTCAVTAEAVRKARQEIRKLRRENPDARLIVTGCAAQTELETFSRMEEVDAVIGNTEKMQPNTWKGMAADFIGETEAVQVQNGCDHRCTFCIIPYGRGNSRSVPAGVVVDQIKRLVDKGYNEVVLTGVDLTSWGADLPAEPRLMPHLHLSLQHGDDLILKRMKRRHLRDDAIRFTEEARKLRPEMTFGADIIAGFPTETEAHFENSLKLVSDCDLTWLHVFPYSKRDGTPAARIPQQINGNIIKDRAARLRAAGEAQVAKHLNAQVGKTHHILMENPHMGRTEQFTEVSFATPQAEGQIVTAKIFGRSDTQLTV